MASQQSNQNQMTRDNIHGQLGHDNPSFLQETGAHVENMAHGATEVGKGAVMGAANIAHGAAQGASSVAQGASDAIKNTFGLGSTTTESAASHPSTNNNVSASTDQSDYPNRPSFPHVP